MYHATLLWDLCDLVNLADRSGVADLAERAGAWRRVIARGLSWLDVLCHPDGDIAFFNDAAFGIAPPPRAIRAFAGALGCAAGEPQTAAMSFEHLVDTGYLSVNLGPGGKALLDVAQVGPGYQPGHAHADTLSFELSLYGQRLLVNSGTSLYGEEAERQRQRGTAAHNTVEIDGEDSSEVWAGFRVARRARPVGLAIWRRETACVVRCAHDGYRQLSGCAAASAPVDLHQPWLDGDRHPVRSLSPGRWTLLSAPGGSGRGPSGAACSQVGSACTGRCPVVRRGS